MSDPDWVARLEACGALRRGHFLLSSGLHSDAYVQCALLLEDVERASEVGAALAALLRDTGPDSVLAPALGGLIIGHEVARALGVPFRFTERQAGEMTLRRGFTLEPGERVVVVEDVVTTGQSVREVEAVAAHHRAEVVGVGAIIDRRSRDLEFSTPLRALVELGLPAFDAGRCPQCRTGAALEKPGSRAPSSKGL